MQILIFSPTSHSPMRRTGASSNDRHGWRGPTYRKCRRAAGSGPCLTTRHHCKVPAVRPIGKSLRTFRDDNDRELTRFELEVVAFGADRGLAVDKLEQLFTGHGEAPTLGEATTLRVQNQAVDIFASH